MYRQQFIPVYGPFFDYDREGCGNYDNIDRGFDYKAGWERSREKTMIIMIGHCMTGLENVHTFANPVV
nr:8633_t:CDS:2 [Entrophospora candida]